MAVSYYDRNLITVTEQLSAKDFEEGWMLRERTIGSLRDARFFTILFSVLGIAFLVLKIPELAQFHWESAIVGLLEFLFCVACIIHQQMVLPQRTQSEAHALYNSNRVLQSEAHLTLTRDGYELKNAYESLMGYWAETAFCAENSGYFVFCGGIDRETLVVSKEGWSDEETRRVSDKMKETFAGRYKYLA